MEYRKIANLIDQESSSEPSKFRTKNLVEVTDESRGHTMLMVKSNSKLVC